MKTLRIDLLAHAIGNLFYYVTKTGKAHSSIVENSEACEMNQLPQKTFDFKWEGAYEASLTK